jgi:large subunit ribosomal protein L28
MPRECVFTGRRARGGWTKAEKGARRDGGVGNKIKGRTKRLVKPNLKKLRIVIDGEVQNVWVSTKAMRQGLVVKPMRVKVAAKAK